MRADVAASVAGPAFVPEAGRPGARRLWVLDRALHIIVALLFGGDFSGFATPRAIAALAGLYGLPLAILRSVGRCRTPRSSPTVRTRCTGRCSRSTIWRWMTSCRTMSATDLTTVFARRRGDQMPSSV
jgi:hypothetical protein